jgi:3-deoxy-D-manno-octulosonic acid kinase
MTPEARTIQESAGEQILFDPEFVSDPTRELFDPAIWGDRATTHTEGRGTVWQLESAEGRWILKRYLRGGLVARVVSDRYFFMGYERTRMAREFRLLCSLCEMRLPVPRPVAAFIQRSGPALYTGSLITQYLEGTQSLSSLIRSGHLRDAPWAALGSTIRRFHDHGVIHPDLNASNILLAEGEIHLIDFDKGRLATPSTNDSWKLANLRRLCRSLEKISTRQASDLDDHWATLLSAYAESSSS